MSKKTVIFGASANPARYSFLAAEMLREHGHEIVPLGIRKGEVSGQEILDIRTFPPIQDVDTVTLYIGASQQSGLYDYVLTLKPRRVIFNPGAENPEFMRALEDAGIQTEEACTLVLLRTGQY